MNLQSLIFVSGILHFGTLLASAAVPQVLDWKAELRKLDRLTRQLVWVHGLFIVLTIIGFGFLTLLFPAELASGTALARGVCGFIAFFWSARLVIQFFVFPGNWPDHLLWASSLTLLLARGPGVISLDFVASRLLTRGGVN